MNRNAFRNLKIRIPMYLIGLLILAFGVTTAAKANLGISQVASIPYALSLITGVELGRMMTIFQIAMIGVEALILRRRFRPVMLLQIAASFFFGYFTTLSGMILKGIPDELPLPAAAALMILSIFLIALALFFYVPPKIIDLPTEGVMNAMVAVSGQPFHRMKILFDCIVVAVALILCLIFLHGFGAVGVGTIASAVFIGLILGWMEKRFGKWRDRLLKPETYAEQ